jgi:hypothetical protein
VRDAMMSAVFVGIFSIVVGFTTALVYVKAEDYININERKS